MTAQQLFLLDQLRLWRANDWLNLLKQFIKPKELPGNSSKSQIPLRELNQAGDLRGFLQVTSGNLGLST